MHDRARAPGDRGALPTNQTAPRDRVEHQGQRSRGGQRGRGRRRILREIDAKARDRQTMWSEAAKLRETEAAERAAHEALATAGRLTDEIGEAYEDLREQRKGAPGEPYKGTTMRLNWVSERTL